MKKCVLVIALLALLSFAAPANARGTGLWGGKTAGDLLSEAPSDGNGNPGVIDVLNLFLAQFKSFAYVLLSR